MTPGMPNPAARSAKSSLATEQVLRRGLGVAVVLDDEDRRQVPDRREIEGSRAWCPGWPRRRRRTRRDPTGALELGGQRAPQVAAGRRRRCRWRRACPWRGRRYASSRPCPRTARSSCRRSRPSSPRRRTPLAMQWPWPRCVLVILSRSSRLLQTPTAKLPRRRKGGRSRGCRRSRTPVHALLELADRPHRAVGSSSCSRVRAFRSTVSVMSILQS